jgi:gluconate 2-dehydrogenase gamma chain
MAAHDGIWSCCCIIHLFFGRHSEVRNTVSGHRDRRDFLKSVATGGTVALTSWPALAAEALDNSLAPGCNVFTISQAALVGAIVEQIVPSDNYPGAKEGGVVAFIDRILAGPFGEFYKARYKQGLLMIDELSQMRFTRNFVSLVSDQQASVLISLESGIGGSSAGREFFGLILQHTIEGYYGDPKHGGNLGGVSWKMIGFAG